jgi:hypothetical protein
MTRSFVSLAILLLAGTAQAADVVITVKGTLAGEDYLGIFGPEKSIPKGTPFTLVYTFDDAVGEAVRVRCPNSGSGVTGSGNNSPGRAVLTIGDSSYAFGDTADSRSTVWRAVPSRCGNGGIAMAVSDGRPPLMSGIQVTIQPRRAPLTTDADWRSPLSLSVFSAPRDSNAFTITRAGSFGLTTRAFLSVESVTVEKPEVGASDGK